VIIREFVGSSDRVEHIARHQVAPEEVDQVLFRAVAGASGERVGKEPDYHVLGQTDAGRYLLCVVIQFPGEKGCAVTARTMTDKEKRRFSEWNQR
jgi:hypothetical protein